MSMSTPPIFAFRSTNWAGVIWPFFSALEPVLDADVVERQAGEAVADLLLGALQTLAGRGPKTLIM